MIILFSEVMEWIMFVVECIIYFKFMTNTAVVNAEYSESVRALRWRWSREMAMASPNKGKRHERISRFVLNLLNHLQIDTPFK